MKSSTDLTVAHPLLQMAVADIMEGYKAAKPGFYLKLTTVFRSKEDQMVAFNQGRSKLLFGNHCLFPSCAIDFTVFNSKGTSVVKDDVPTWNSDYYKPLGPLADKAGLFWGGYWQNFYDGPHIEIPAGTFDRELQKMLRHLKLYSGQIDGQWGPKSRAALQAFGVAPVSKESVYWGHVTGNIWMALWTKIYGSDPAKWLENWKTLML